MLPPARPPGLRWLQARAAAPGIEPHIIFMLLILPFQNIKIALHPTLSNSTINKNGGWFRIPSPIFETGRRTNGEFSSLHPLNYRYQTTACLNSCNARYLVMLFTHAEAEILKASFLGSYSSSPGVAHSSSHIMAHGWPEVRHQYQFSNSLSMKLYLISHTSTA